MLAPWKESYEQPRQHIEKQRHYFVNKGPSSQSYGFSSSHVWVWELDNKKDWEPKNWCLWTVALKKTLDSPLDSKGIKPVNPKGNQPWIFIGRTSAEARAPILMAKPDMNWLIWRDPDAGKDWGQKEETTEYEMFWWHHWLDGHELEQILGDDKGQGSLACCSPWGHKESDPTYWLNNKKAFAHGELTCITVGTWWPWW